MDSIDFKAARRVEQALNRKLTRLEKKILSGDPLDVRSLDQVTKMQHMLMDEITKMQHTLDEMVRTRIALEHAHDVRMANACLAHISGRP